ncbi:MAG: MiaB/RimO family radical SAM methylthiotransferase, partial [Chitinivibrionales bacterium]|nr:MiaB/RimO family radical SAM methylthiotransferase [Chitinivibrionales bacterium]MBD3358510.1 MiaB/RimO family radical SAM methylthiotransferase [Chitinivibrionales bacterium]
EKRAQARISQYAGAKAAARQPQTLWVIGCMAERLGNSLKEMIPGVDRVIGATKLEYIAHDIDGYLTDCDPEGHAPPRSENVTAFLPIMRGCNNYCTYCIVPYVRGDEHSMPLYSLEERVKRMVENGVREVTLLGQNVNSYRDGRTDFSDLLHQLHRVEGLRRLRFTTSHPKDCGEKLIRTIAELPKVCTHIHLPVQSGSTTVLRRMNRVYTRDEYLRLTDMVRTHIPAVDLTSDIMVGFPGESEKEYHDTLSLVERVRFTTAFMFAYSEREGTKAASMDGNLSPQVRKERLERLIELQTQITKEQYSSMVGRTVNVLLSQRQRRRDKAWMGQDYGCKRVLLACREELAGTILDLKVVRSTGMTLVCERI